MLNSREKGSLLRNSFLRFSTTLLSHVHPTCPPETCLTLTQDFLLKMPGNSYSELPVGGKLMGCAPCKQMQLAKCFDQLPSTRPAKGSAVKEFT